MVKISTLKALNGDIHKRYEISCQSNVFECGFYRAMLRTERGIATAIRLSVRPTFIDIPPRGLLSSLSSSHIVK